MRRAYTALTAGACRHVGSVSAERLAEYRAPSRMRSQVQVLTNWNVPFPVGLGFILGVGIESREEEVVVEASTLELVDEGEELRAARRFEGLGGKAEGHEELGGQGTGLGDFGVGQGDKRLDGTCEVGGEWIEDFEEVVLGEFVWGRGAGDGWAVVGEAGKRWYGEYEELGGLSGGGGKPLSHLGLGRESWRESCA
ncbi:hypothetical protein B0H11DRAFT_1937912 [Mycena galericulata]|nr:hypothetical protein B0H11DRAFT_1937912 [Mycena galericulata]